MLATAMPQLGSRFPYKDMLDPDAMSAVMADLCWTEGLTEGRKMADTYHRRFPRMAVWRRSGASLASTPRSANPTH